MTKEEFKLKHDGYEINGVWFLPDGAVIATAHLIHGQGDFIKRYREVAKIFCSYGIAVCGVDLPGHGESSGKRGDVPSLNLVRALFQETKEMIESRFPSLPRGLMAHSMGGLLGIQELTKRPDYYDFSWLSSPLVKPSKNRPERELFFLRQLAKLVPSLTINTGVKRELCRRIPKSLKLTHKNNPLFHKKISLRWGAELLKMAEDIESNNTMSEISTKTLLTQGSRDHITPLRYAKEFLTRKAWVNLEMRVISNALHEPFRDITRKECFMVIQDWLESQVCPIITCDKAKKRFLISNAA